MKETLKQDLLACVVDGNIASLPTTPLNNYPELKKALTKATGKYKKNTFVFPSPAQPIIDALVGGTVVDFKKEFQFFATPPELAERICNDVIFVKDEMDILEPSAGHGVFIDELLKLSTSVKKNFDLVELSHLNFNVLKDKFSNNSNVDLFHTDFLTYYFGGKKYDLIIANPPFSKNQDIDHIKKMYSLLKDGGQLLTISSKSWTFGNQKKQVEFRDWLDEIEATFIDIESGSFKSSGTNVIGMYIQIVK